MSPRKQRPSQQQIDQMLKEAEAHVPEEVAREYTDFEKGRLQEYEEKRKEIYR